MELGNGYAAGTQSDSHTGHQVLNRCLVKSEFILGLADLIVDTLGSGTIPHVQEQVAELINYRDVLRSCVRAAEADAKLNQYGMMCPDMNAIRAGRTLFGRSMFPRMVEIIQMLGTGGLMALPAEADFDSGIGAEIERYFATDSTDARERARVFHLAWERLMQRLQRAAGTVRADVRRQPRAQLHNPVPELRQGTVQGQSPPVPRTGRLAVETIPKFLSPWGRIRPNSLPLEGEG